MRFEGERQCRANQFRVVIGRKRTASPGDRHRFDYLVDGRIFDRTAASEEKRPQDKKDNTHSVESIRHDLILTWPRSARQ